MALTRLDTRRGRGRRGGCRALVHHYFGTKQQLFAAAIHIPIDPDGGPGAAAGNARRRSSACTLPSLLLPLWDSELGAGLIATLRSLLAGTEVKPGPLVPAGGDRPRNRCAGGQSARHRGVIRVRVRRIADARRGDGALHPRGGAVRVAAGRADRARPSRPTCSATSPGICRSWPTPAAMSRACSSSSTSRASSTSSTGMPSSMR